MGVLDDAIREHLELRRQHGVAEEELRRQEEEALGPARREVAATESAEGDVTAPEADAAEAEEVTPDAVEHPAPEPVEQRAPDTVESEPVEAPPEPLDAPFDADADADAVDDPARPTRILEEEEATGTPPPTGAAERGFEDPTGTTPAGGFERLEEDEDDHAPSGELGEEGGAEDEHHAEDPDDVLEDTPDFLQETPEHDRLWFEQKPPRDFDFD